MILDFLHTVDWIVDRPVDVAEKMARVLGLPDVRADFVQDLPSHGYEAVFARTANRLTDAPTRLEFIAARTVTSTPGCSVAPLEFADRLQSGRAQRTHATVVCVSDLDAAVDAIRATSTPVWLEPTCSHLPHPRAWVGWVDGSYVSGYDAGILLELIPTWALGHRIEQSVASPDHRTVPSARVTRRVHLVADLSEALHMLETRCLMEPGDVRASEVLGAHVARFDFRHPTSAVLELASPNGAGPCADYLSTWGPGPMLTSFGVIDPDATTDAALAEGATTWRSTSESDLLIHPELPGILFEITNAAPAN